MPADFFSKSSHSRSEPHPPHIGAEPHRYHHFDFRRHRVHRTWQREGLGSARVPEGFEGSEHRSHVYYDMVKNNYFNKRLRAGFGRDGGVFRTAVGAEPDEAARSFRHEVGAIKGFGRRGERNGGLFRRRISSGLSSIVGDTASACGKATRVEEGAERRAIPIVSRGRDLDLSPPMR